MHPYSLWKGISRDPGLSSDLGFTFLIWSNNDKVEELEFQRRQLYIFIHIKYCK